VQGIFKSTENHVFQVYHDGKNDRWICSWGKKEDVTLYLELPHSNCLICFSLYDNEVSQYIKDNMSLNPFLEYLPRFSRQQRVNTQQRLIEFVLKDIAVDILKFL
jgi:hypothetical protein